MSAHWLDQPNPGESFDQWLNTAECQRLLDGLSRPALDPEPGPNERECRADSIYHAAIAWAAENEPDTTQRRILIREAYTSPEMAACHAYAHGYTQAVEDHHAELQAVIDQRDRLGAHVAAISRASRHQRARERVARERLYAALYRVTLAALVVGGLVVLGVAQRWVRGW